MMTGVGTEVRRLREAKGWGQTKLAAEAGMAVSGVSQIENGHRNPNSATLIKLARALEVEVSELFPKAQAPLPVEGNGRELEFWRIYLAHLVDRFEELAEEDAEPCRRGGWGDIAAGVAGDALAAIEVLLNGVQVGAVSATTADVRGVLRAGFRLAKAADRIDELSGASEAPSEEAVMQGVRRRQDRMLTEIKFQKLVEGLELSAEDREAISTTPCGPDTTGPNPGRCQ
jgi:transcriptional regulator with XRE-family HTH domain